ncbi:MAG: TauD/TfdA family dioxygenase, partial [Candidatus Latescibacteria bacterium]|nr:TauD/TfdA family dioxygenase [Candidatus Latescibacterota bacterium]
MRITPLTAHIGAAVEDIDLTAPLDETTRTSLRTALCRSAVLAFRNQALTDAQQVSFTKALGPLEPTIPSDPIGDGGPI